MDLFKITFAIIGLIALSWAIYMYYLAIVYYYDWDNKIAAERKRKEESSKKTD